MLQAESTTYYTLLVNQKMLSNLHAHGETSGRAHLSHLNATSMAPLSTPSSLPATYTYNKHLCLRPHAPYAYLMVETVTEVDILCHTKLKPFQLIMKNDE